MRYRRFSRGAVTPRSRNLKEGFMNDFTLSILAYLNNIINRYEHHEHYEQLLTYSQNFLDT